MLNDINKEVDTNTLNILIINRSYIANTIPIFYLTQTEVLCALILMELTLHWMEFLDHLACLEWRGLFQLQYK